MNNSFKYNFVNKLRIISSAMNKMLFPSIIQRSFNDLRHRTIKRQLYPYFKYANLKLKHYYNLNIKYNSNIIWLFWWQGNNMPIIVRRCIESIKRNSNNHKVILITRYNVKQYSNLPFYIYNKLKNKGMSLAHFSDALRFNLLRNYGGLWIDSTMLCTSKLSDIYFSDIYTSGGYNNKNNYFVSSKWTLFLIGGYKNNRLFIFMDEFFKYYWRHNSNVIDYFLTDYALDFVYQHNIGGFKYYVDNYAYKNNPHLYDLLKYLNSSFEINKYNNLIHDTNLFKLTYKNTFNNNHDTFYNKIINKRIP